VPVSCAISRVCVTAVRLGGDYIADDDGTDEVCGRKVWRLELGVKLSTLPRTLSESPAATSSWLRSWVASTTSMTFSPIDCVSRSNCCSSAVSRCSSSAVWADRSDASDAVSSSIYTQQHLKVKGNGRYSPSWKPHVRANRRSLAICDHIVLPATRHKWTCPAKPQSCRLDGWYSIYLPRRDGRPS